MSGKESDTETVVVNHRDSKLYRNNLGIFMMLHEKY